MGPFIHVIKPEIERDLNNSISGNGWLSLGLDWSCGPQFASQMPLMPWGSGKLRNDCNFVDARVLNEILRFLVPFRYFMTRRAASMCPFEGFLQYLASMFVIVAISGRVETLNQLSDPTSICIWVVSRFWVMVS